MHLNFLSCKVYLPAQGTYPLNLHINIAKRLSGVHMMFRRFKKVKNGVKATLHLQEQGAYLSRQQVAADRKVSLKSDELFEGRTVYLFPVSIKGIGGNKWGYIHAMGNIILPPVYEHADDFQENGLAIIRLNNSSGLIDVKGYFIVKPKYETIHPFSEGRATVIDHHGFKVIDESGKEITHKAYAYIGDYKEGRALIADKDAHGHYLYGYLNKRGKEVLPLAYESASDFKDGKAIVKLKGEQYALISLTGKILHTYPYSFVGNYGEGLLAFQKRAGEKYGYMDEQGTTIIPPKFTDAQLFIEDRAIIHVSENNKEYYGLIDRNGQYIFKPNYNNLMYLGEERLAIGKAINPEKPYIGSIYAVADTYGHILTGFIYNSITKYEKGTASASNDQSTFFIDKSGKRIASLPTVSGSGELHFDKTLIRGKIDFRLFYYKKTGEIVWKHNTVISLQDSYTVMEHKYKPNKDFLVYYPQINGMENQEAQTNINQSLKDLAGMKETPSHLQLESNYMSDFELTFYQKNLLVIEINGYNYPFGAAHGMPVKKYAHIDLITGEIYQLKELFKPGSQYVKIISEMIGNEMKSNEKYSFIFPGSYKGIQADQSFFINEGGLNVYFSPYEIAPYAAGFPTFTIPFKDIIRIIDQSSAFWKSFH